MDKRLAIYKNDQLQFLKIAKRIYLKRLSFIVCPIILLNLSSFHYGKDVKIYEDPYF